MGINRNEPCPCGSGLKYKKCCLSGTQAATIVTPTTDTEALIDQGFALHQSDQLEAAAIQYSAALAQSPSHPDAMRLLGAVKLQQGKYAESIVLYEETLRVHGQHRDSLYNLGNALRGANRNIEAISVYRDLLHQYPNDVAVLNNLALTLRPHRRNAEALACLEQAQQLAPTDTEILNNLGMTLLDMNRIDESIAVLQSALTLNPDQPEICNNLGNALQRTGNIEAAIPLLRQALKLRPHYPQAHSNLIFLLDFIEQGGAAQQQQERIRWAEHYAQPIPARTAFTNDRSPERKLRIGYVSPDFRQHSAAYTFGPMLLNYDRSAFEVICFSNTAIGDDLTDRFKSAVDGWHDIWSLTDSEAAMLIEGERIDILIDLAGHSANNRLGIFAYRPAPIQASGWGHANGTGLATMDYLFSDPIYIPPADAAHYREALRYLPCALGYLAPGQPPEISPLPALKNGYLTFGSFNRLSKVNATTLAHWIELLHQHPNSHLLIKTPELNSPLRQQQLRSTFEQAGIAAARLQLQAGTPWQEHLAAIGSVDVALDPFPHGGGVSVFDCLLMGVPVLAVQAPIPTGRLAASILHAAGLDGWVAAEASQLIPVTQRQCANIDALAMLRTGLRHHLETETIIGNPARYCQAVERELRHLWRHWCSSAPSSAHPAPSVP